MPDSIESAIEDIKKAIAEPLPYAGEKIHFVQIIFRGDFLTMVLYDRFHHVSRDSGKSRIPDIQIQFKAGIGTDIVYVI